MTIGVQRSHADREGNRPPLPTELSPTFPLDPPVRADGRCARDGCGKLRKPELSKRYAGIEGERDPFCSADCCRAFYGLVDMYDDDGRVTRVRDADEAWLC